MVSGYGPGDMATVRAQSGLGIVADWQTLFVVDAVEQIPTPTGKGLKIGQRAFNILKSLTMVEVIDPGDGPAPEKLETVTTHSAPHKKARRK